MLTANEVANRLGIKRSAVYNLCYKPSGLRAYKVGGCLRFKPEEVEAYKRQKSAPPGEATPDRASGLIQKSQKAAFE